MKLSSEIMMSVLSMNSFLLVYPMEPTLDLYEQKKADIIKIVKKHDMYCINAIQEKAQTDKAWQIILSDKKLSGKCIKLISDATQTYQGGISPEIIAAHLGSAGSIAWGKNYIKDKRWARKKLEQHLVYVTNHPYSDLNIISSIIKMGIDPNAFVASYFTNTKINALHQAAANNKKDIAALLINHKAQVNRAHPYNNYTPLMRAVKNNHLETAHYLIEQNAQVNTQSSRGATCLEWAIKNSNYDMVSLLLEHNADYSILNNKGYTALDQVKDILHSTKKLEKLCHKKQIGIDDLRIDYTLIEVLLEDKRLKKIKVILEDQQSENNDLAINAHSATCTSDRLDLDI